MKIMLIVSVLLLFISGKALAGGKYDECIKEEKALKAQETGDCSGLRYMFNPSACFATRKLFKEYAAGKCRQIGMAENVDLSVQKIIPEKKINNTLATRPDNIVEKAAVNKTEPVLPEQESTIKQLKEENARLKTEISILKTENDQLRKAGR